MPVSEKVVLGWLASARTGSPEALGEALEACRGYLIQVAKGELGADLQAKGGPSDLVQQTMLDAVCDFERFHGVTEAELIQWLRRLLLNNLADFARRYRDAEKRQVGREASLADSSSHEPPGALAALLPSPSGAAVAGEEGEMVQRALQALPDNYRCVILWRYQEGRSFEEIGKALELTANGARKLLLRAIRRVRQDLGEA